MILKVQVVAHVAIRQLHGDAILDVGLVVVGGEQQVGLHLATIGIEVGTSCIGLSLNITHDVALHPYLLLTVGSIGVLGCSSDDILNAHLNNFYSVLGERLLCKEVGIFFPSLHGACLCDGERLHVALVGARSLRI